MSRVPLVDIQPFLHGSESEKGEVARAVDRACRDSGFLLVAGHGVPEPVRAEVERAMHAFFALPAEIKDRWAYTPDNPRGYRGMARTTLAKSRGDYTPPDVLERFIMSQFDLPDDDYHNTRRDTVFHDNRWPDAVPTVEPAAKAYYREMERLAADLMRVLTRALGLPERFFEPYFDKHTSLLVSNFYPAQDKPPEPGQMRAGAHTDYGSLTILTPSTQPGGLQVQRPDGSWEAVPQVAGALVVNLGDFMALWTNDRWNSTMHRVVNPEGPDAAAARMSIVFFQQPNDDALISCIPTCATAAHPAKYAPITSGDYLHTKIKSTWTAQANHAAAPGAGRA